MRKPGGQEGGKAGKALWLGRREWRIQQSLSQPCPSGKTLLLSLYGGQPRGVPALLPPLPCHQTGAGCFRVKCSA